MCHLRSASRLKIFEKRKIHNDRSLNEITGKPNYDTTFSIDIVDQQCAICNRARTSKMWPIEIFYRILNIAATNLINGTRNYFPMSIQSLLKLFLLRYEAKKDDKVQMYSEEHISLTVTC